MVNPLCRDQSHVRVHNPVTNRWDWARDDMGEPIMKPCGNASMTGFDKCFIHIRHGDQTQSYVRRHSPQIGQLLSEMDLPDMSGADGLLEAVRYSGAMMRSMAVLVGELTEKPELVPDGDGGQSMIEPGIWGMDRFGEQAPHVLMKLYDIWMERYTRSCKMAVDAGLDERMVRNAEATSSTMLQAFEAALRLVPTLTQDQRDALANAMANQVRALIMGDGTPPRPLPGTIDV
jgi:hypothetical protein